MTKGILSEEKQARAREMLREISEHYIKIGVRWYMTQDKVALEKAWRMKRKFTFAEWDLISQVHGRIRKGGK